MAELPVKARLESGSDINTICRYLDRWVKNRRTLRCIKHFAEASDPIALPRMPDKTDESVWFDEEEGQTETDVT
jgi:hypothetical protein